MRRSFSSNITTSASTDRSSGLVLRRWLIRVRLGGCFDDAAQRSLSSEITEIGVFLTKLPLSKKFTETEEVETTMKENGKPVEMRFFFSKNSQKNTWDSKVVVDATPVSYGVRFQVFFWLQ